MLKFILIVLIIIFLIRILGRLFIVSTFKKLNKRVEDEMRRRQDFNAPPRQEGQVTIDPQAGKKKGNDDEGEFVDYEEIK